MKKGENLIVKISGIDSRGKSYSYLENEKIYVNINAAKDQLVEGILGKMKKNKYELKNCKIIDYANRKNSIYDNLEKQIGGCNYQYYSYEEQLEIKNNSIKNILDENIKYDYDYQNPIESVEKIYYRNKMEFSFGNEYKDGETLLGLHKKNSFHDIDDVSYCKLMDENFNKIYMFTNEIIKKYNLDFYHRISHIGYLRNLVIRKSQNEILINLVTSSQIEKNLEKKFLEDYVEGIKKIQLSNSYYISGIIHTINNKLSDCVFSEKENILYGKRDLTYELLGLKFSISPYSFFQTNTKTVEKLYEIVLEYLSDIKSKDLVAFDLFSGTGTIGQIISSKVKKVYGIELVKEAVDKANENVKLNNIDNCKFIDGDVFEKLDELEQADILILDPPRMGVGTKTIEKLVKYNTENIIYVSCNPKTFIEDLKEFEKYNYKLKKVRIVDMFPYTVHLELVTLLEKIG